MMPPAASGRDKAAPLQTLHLLSSYSCIMQMARVAASRRLLMLWSLPDLTQSPALPQVNVQWHAQPQAVAADMHALPFCIMRGAIHMCMPSIDRAGS